jgi:hypothetical protein
MGTTPNLGFPFPEGGDLVIGGDDAIEALAAAVDAYLTAALAVKYLTATGAAGDVPAGGGFFGMQYAANTAEGFTTSDFITYTYTGPPRIFRIDAGATLSNDTTVVASQELQLLTSGGVAQRTRAFAEVAGLHVSYVAQLIAGDTLAAQVASGGSAGGSYQYGYLNAVAVPS